MIKILILLILMTVFCHANETRKKIIERGSINCGVSQGVIGFSSIDKDQWVGMDVDFCKAVSAAVFGNANKVNFFPISQRDRSDVVRGGQVDLLARNFTWTFNREVDSGNHAFIRISYYDGEGFMVRKSSKITSVYQLNNISICAVIGATSETTARDFFEKQNKQHSIISFRDWEEATNAYDQGRCDAMLIDHSMLYAFKLKLKKPEDHVVLKEIINKAPTAIWVKYDDKNWYNIVTWVINILILAEEHGINSNNIDNMLLSKDPEIKKILGLEGNFGKKLGLSNDWAYNVIKQVGNYEEIFERNLGSKSNLKIERGYNKLWTKGGLMYAPPLK